MSNVISAAFKSAVALCVFVSTIALFCLAVFLFGALIGEIYNFIF